MENLEIFVSYAWKDESRTLTEAIDKFFQEKGITIARDNRNIGYKGLIKEYMQRLGQGKYVVVVLSDAYFKSKSCMYELMQLAENKDFYDRIFPVTVAGTSLYEAEDLLKYVNYWDEKIESLNSQIRQTKNIGNLQGITDDLNLYNDIRHNIAKLIDFLRNINTHPLQGSDFEPLYAAMQIKMQQDASAPTTPPQLVTTPGASPSPTSRDNARIDRQIADLQSQLDLLDQKLSRLKYARNIQTDESVKFQLEHQIAECQAEITKIEQQKDDLERKKKR